MSESLPGDLLLTSAEVAATGDIKSDEIKLADTVDPIILINSFNNTEQAVWWSQIYGSVAWYTAPRAASTFLRSQVRYALPDLYKRWQDRYRDSAMLRRHRQDPSGPESTRQAHRASPRGYAGKPSWLLTSGLCPRKLSIRISAGQPYSK